MGRRSGFTGIVIAAARASARAARQAEANQRRMEAARIRSIKADIRDNARMEKEAIKQAKIDYLQSQQEKVGALTYESNSLFRYVSDGIIQQTLEIDDTVAFDSLKPKYLPPKYSIPNELKDLPVEPRELDFIKALGPMPFWAKIFKSSKIKWEIHLEETRLFFERFHSEWDNKVKTLQKLREEDIEKHSKLVNKYDEEYGAKISEINDFEKAYLGRDEEAVVAYASMVLERSEYDFEWNRNFDLGYNSESKEMIVQFELPLISIVPTVEEYKYVKAKNEIVEKLRKPKEIQTAYSRLICSLALRTIHELVESDQADAISIIDFNGYVNSIDEKTGKNVSPVLLSISVSKDFFNELVLDKIDPIKAVKNISSSFSPSPSELLPVKPIREFSMVDKRYVPEQDVASSMDSRPNLMELNPFEFENLVSNLFSKMGLETKQTRSSKDGGVDAIAFDLRPILGGKVVIQAKRYKNTVGVSAVRDLYGTMINEGAAKGILVATSGYGPDAYEFSNSKPIELIDGNGLLYLLDQVGIKAKIIIPDEA